MSTRVFCIHGHFYQPPREDPLTGEIPIEPGAMPYRNWNERIHDQCYKPNAELGNFGRISFNLGPTLIQWMFKFDRPTLAKIIQQDHDNLQHYGAGNAMAQPYNHTILPLSSYHDKVTQVRWGIQNFEHYFGRRPLGMWLPETAVDYETLDVLAECGIEYTILAPWQAHAKKLDVTQPYRVPLRNGKSISVFFYNQELSMRVSFDPGATVNGDLFLHEHILPQFDSNKAKSESHQFIIIASDGELYGHHQPYRDKFLAYLLDGALRFSQVTTCFPALWLRLHPAQKEIAIRPNTSWSCHHGIKRWHTVCGCASDGAWKAPLRQAFNRLAELIDEKYLAVLSPYLTDPWELRHGYSGVVDGYVDPVEYIRSVIQGHLDKEQIQKIRLLLAAQYERQRMFTSCGWFFDEFDRIEPRNNVAYAAQAVWLTYLATGEDLSPQILQWLKRVKSTRTGLRASDVFKQHLQRARDSLKPVRETRHPAIADSNLFSW